MTSFLTTGTVPQGCSYAQGVFTSIRDACHGGDAPDRLACVAMGVGPVSRPGHCGQRDSLGELTSGK